MKTCLIVDDSATIQKIGCRILERLGIEAVAAHNLEEAIRFCDVRLPDIIIVDWDLPGLDPVRFAAHIRRLRGGENVHILSCNFEGDAEQAEKAARDGFSGRLMKPFDQSIVQGSLIAAGVFR